MRLFDTAAAEYDAARPSYPAALYDLLESACGELAGKIVADGGAGTGVVTRELIRRRAVVIAFDPGPGMLRRALARSPGLRVVLADAAAVPLRSRCLDLICFGQSWHWVDQDLGAQEAARVLKHGGWWAAWWNHPWADSEAWFDEYSGLLEERCAAFSRDQRNVDWCSTSVRDARSFRHPTRRVVEWERQVTVEDWLVELRSHSYVIDLADADTTSLLVDAESILRNAFPGGIMVVPYETCLWMAQVAATGPSQ